MYSQYKGLILMLLLTNHELIMPIGFSLHRLRRKLIKPNKTKE